MTRSFRSFFFPSILVFVFIASGTATGRAGVNANPDSTRITAAANVTLRALPSATAAAVAQLPLGTELTDAGPAGLDKTWLRVKATDGKEGWIQASLTKTLDPHWRWATFDRIVAERLGRKGDGFPALAELVAFIERVAPEYTDANGRAQLEFSRLRAVAATVAAIPKNSDAREPYVSWLAKHKAEVFPDEPGGRWMLLDRAIWDAHSRITSVALADDVAWFAVTNGLGGECEGWLPCYVEWRNRLHGEYLRRHPAGKHAGEAVTVVKDTVDRVSAPGAYEFDRAKDCKGFTATIDALTTAVKGTRVANRDATLGSLGTLKRFCQSN